MQGQTPNASVGLEAENIKAPADLSNLQYYTQHQASSLQVLKPNNPIMLTSRNTILCLMVSSAGVYAEHLRVIWSSGSFSTISGPSGNEGGSYSGFAIINDAGEAVYDQDYPDDHAPCTYAGRTFTIEGDCWNTARQFSCVAAFDGAPQTCEVLDSAGASLGKADAQKDTTFIGIAIGIDASCVIEFESDGTACPVDDGNGPLHVTSG